MTLHKYRRVMKIINLEESLVTVAIYSVCLIYAGFTILTPHNVV